MHMVVKEQSKIVELWLTKEEKNDPALRKSLKPIYQQYKDQKYLVAVFLSVPYWKGKYFSKSKKGGAVRA